MTDKQFAERAVGILHNMSLERKGWKGFFRRWLISDEPLRNDAASLLREYDINLRTPIGCRRVGSDE